jgi:uncharacterized protein YjbI with pentapeptide repeats
MRFSLRTLFVVALLVGLMCGWYATWQRVDRDRKRYEQQLQYAEKELLRAKDQLHDLARGKQPDATRPFWEAELAGSQLTGMTIASDNNAFQRASFRNCKLESATLAGGVASFQDSCFDGATLTQANLSGGSASFQASTFLNTDLTGATLTGGPGSFQGASFEGAVLIGAKLLGNFQGANLSGAKLQGADVSALAGKDLASCYFDRPPTYDAQTKFPTDFDPQEHLWRRAE